MTPDEAQPILNDAEASLQAADAARAAVLFRAVLAGAAAAEGGGPSSHQKAQAEAGLGETSLLEGRPLEAAERFLRAAHLDPGESAWLAYRVGEAWMKAGEWEKAAEAFQTALADWSPGDRRGRAEMLARRGLARFRGGDKGGEEDLRQALRETPLEAGLHADLGDCLLARKDFPGAEASYGRAAELEPGNPDHAASLERTRAIAAKLAKGRPPA